MAAKACRQRHGAAASVARGGAPGTGDARQIGLYFGALALAAGLGSPGGHGAPAGLASLPIKFFLSDRLGLGPEAVSVFWAVISLPLYCGCLFGLLRDHWRPTGWGDRGYLLVAAPVVAGCYLWLAAGAIDAPRLLAATLLAVCAYQVLNSASGAMMTAVAQRRLMTGRLGSLASLAAAAPAVLASLGGGWLAAHVSPQATFALAALLPLAIFAQSFWRPAAVFSPGETVGSRPNTQPSPLSRLLRHRALWPAAAICLLWDFAPGWGTALFFHLTRGVGLSPTVMGLTDSVSAGCTAAGAVAYAFFCQRLPMSRLLRWSLTLGILCGPLYILIGNAWEAIAISATVGLLQGFTNAGFRGDLLMRACPAGLEGSGRMLGASASAIAVGAGDLLGAWLYARGGFTLCLIITTCTTCLILPFLFRLPKSITAAREGEGDMESVAPAPREQPVPVGVGA